MSILTPTFADIFARDIEPKEVVNRDSKHVCYHFIDGKTFPTFVLLKRAHRQVRHVLAKQQEVNLLFPLVEQNKISLTQLDKTAGLAELYGEGGLGLLTNRDQLERVYDFTYWLDKKYRGLLKVGDAEIADKVWNDLQISFRDSLVNTREGELRISFLNKVGRKKKISYAFERMSEKKPAGESVSQLSLSRINQSKTVDPYSQTASSRTVVYARTSVPAPYSTVILPIIRYHLLGQLFCMSKK